MNSTEYRGKKKIKIKSMMATHVYYTQLFKNLFQNLVTLKLLYFHPF